MNALPRFSPQLATELTAFPQVISRLQAPNLTILVSLSGGLDFVSLLLWAKQHYPQAQILAHHQAIYEDSYSTIPYCRQLCTKLDVPLHIQQAVYIQRERTYKNGRPSRLEWQLHLTDIPLARALPYTQVEAAELYGVTDSKNVVAGILDFAEARGAPPTQRIR